MNVRTFVIADVRGYTRFTRESGDASAARLADTFADLARDAAAARGGEMLELRGDEALSIFSSPAQAVRAAIEFQVLCAEEYASDPTLPLTVGVGIDAGEALPVQGGFRGAALNMAARLCSNAGAGQVLVSRRIADLVAEEPDIHLEDRGEATLKLDSWPPVGRLDQADGSVEPTVPFTGGVDVSPDGSLLALGGWARAPLLAHAAVVASLNFNPDGTTFATSGVDGLTYLWDAETGRSLGTPFDGRDAVMNAFSIDGRPCT